MKNISAFEMSSSIHDKTIIVCKEETRKGKTTILIAHRISTIKSLDKILFIEDGKVLGFDTESAIRAGTLHDFFLERDDENIATETKMLIKHPSMAKENAINYFGVNEKEQNIIESHMFPISNVAPKYKEAWVVTFCDKIVALMEGASRAKAQVSLWMLFLINFVR